MSLGHLWPLILKLLAAAFASFILGLATGHYWLGATLFLAAMLLREFLMLQRLLRWLRLNSADQAPEFGGFWGDAVAMIVRVYRRKQFHKQRLLRVLRELRESTTAMPDGVVVLNPQAEMLWFNRTAERLLNLRGRDDLGLRVENLVRYPEFVKYLRSGSYAVPIIVRTTAGTDMHLALQLVPYGAGQLLLLVRDVTREASIEAMRKDFVANASHELRSPLTVIAGYLETLAQDPGLDAALQPPLAEMQRQAQRMNGILQDLLELSRLEASDREVIGEPIDIAALLAQLRQDVLARPTHPAQVRVQVDSEALLVGDPAQIHSAFGNLVDNAAQYTPADGSLEMRWWTDGGGGHFSVTDTGIGIAAEHLPRLTERFYRVDPGRSRASGGSGLGLSIVKHALQRHGATLEIQSEEGKGSRFICHFPQQRLRTGAHASTAAAL
jgi:two-component system phosphate regulon sensor histidine kinase PhoR